MIFTSHQSIPLFYYHSQVIFHSIFLLYSPLFHFMLLLSRFNFHSCLYHCAPDKNISQYHSDSASNMPQLPAVNQWVQTRVYKHKRYVYCSKIFKILFSDFMTVIANSVNAFGK